MTPSETPAIAASFELERTYPRPPHRVFALLSSADAKRRWFLEGRETQIASFEMDFRVGGKERGRYTYHAGSPVDGMPFINEGVYLDIVENRRIVLASSMSIGGRRVSFTLATFELEPAGEGTQLRFIHQAVFYEGSGGREMRESGWKTLLDRFAAALDAALDAGAAQ